MIIYPFSFLKFLNFLTFLVCELHVFLDFDHQTNKKIWSSSLMNFKTYYEFYVFRMISTNTKSSQFRHIEPSKTTKNTNQKRHTIIWWHCFSIYATAARLCVLKSGNLFKLSNKFDLFIGIKSVETPPSLNDSFSSPFCRNGIFVFGPAIWQCDFWKFFHIRRKIAPGIHQEIGVFCVVLLVSIQLILKSLNHKTLILHLLHQNLFEL